MLMSQVFGALFLSSCGVNGGFHALQKSTDSFDEKASNTSGKTPSNPYGSCQEGDVYGYGHFTDANGNGGYGYGPCSSMDDYGLGRDLKGYQFGDEQAHSKTTDSTPDLKSSAPQPTPTPTPTP